MQLKGESAKIERLSAQKSQMEAELDKKADDLQDECDARSLQLEQTKVKCEHLSQELVRLFVILIVPNLSNSRLIVLQRISRWSEQWPS